LRDNLADFSQNEVKFWQKKATQFCEWLQGYINYLRFNFSFLRLALNKEEQGHAIDFAKKAGALLVGAIVVASLATPLAGYGAELGKYFFDNFSFQPSDKEPVSEYMSQFTDWFAEQDQNTLLKKVKGD
jgi:hypothetical protein